MALFDATKPRAMFMGGGNTASPFYNNLTATTEGCLIYAHREKVVVARALGAVPLSQIPETIDTVQCLKAHGVRGRTMLVVCNKLATVVYDVERDAPLVTVPGGPSDVRSCAIVNFNDIQCILLGMGDGSVAIHQLNMLDFSFIASSRSPVHGGAVTAISAGTPEHGVAAITGDNVGELRFWNGQLQPFTSVAAPGDCVTSIAMFNGYAAVAYGSGQIKLFVAASGEIRVSIAAHSRWINALTYCPTTNQLASVGEDNVLNVWFMPSQQDGRVGLVKQFLEPNRLLVGVAFTGGGKIVATAAFESESLQLYSLGH